MAREGNFTRNTVGEVDEAEIFEGAQNRCAMNNMNMNASNNGKTRLTMNQTYTHEFQCQYELQRYPFDLQVKDLLSFLVLMRHKLCSGV